MLIINFVFFFTYNESLDSWQCSRGFEHFFKLAGKLKKRFQRLKRTPQRQFFFSNNGEEL